MEIHTVFGPNLSDHDWVPAPSYLLRRQLVLRILDSLKKGALLEIGSGPAALLYELSMNGWDCSALEQSEEALAIARNIHTVENGAKIYDTPQADWKDKYDCLISMEVLEHIDDDLAALVEWRTWIKPGGKILLSVPAHEKKWSTSDVWAGHFRRYERNRLIELVEKAGYEVEQVLSYGFPLANIIGPIRAWHHTRQLKRISNSDTARLSKRLGSDRSGTSRSIEKRLYPLYSSFIGVSAIKAALWLQDKFLRTDLGTGYLIQAKRPD